jgi:hypothetical protein
MFNPLVDNLSELKDQEIEEKILELSKKYFQAQRLGKIEMLTQIETFIIMYKDERQRRLHARKSDLDNDLDQLINVS